MKRASAAGLRVSGLAAFMVAVAGSPAMPQDPDPMAILKAMSDYLASTEAFAFEYDTTLDVVTTEDQKIGLAASGTAVVARPDRIRATRAAGFAEVEIDGVRRRHPLGPRAKPRGFMRESVPRVPSTR
jgi:hypothetical protein